MKKPWINNDYLRMAFDEPDAVSPCEQVSRIHGDELTLEQAGEIMDAVEDLCEGCLQPLNEETGYCDPCSEPVSA